MAKKRSISYLVGGSVAIAGGATLTGIEVFGTVSYLVSQAQPSYLVAGGAVVTIVAAVLPLLIVRSLHGRQYILAAMFLAAMVPAHSVIFTAAVERTGGAKDAAERDRQAIAQRIELARDAVKDAKARLQAAETAVRVETSNPKKPGCGPACRGFKKEAEAARKELAAARDALVAAGVAPKDPTAQRLAAMVPGLTEEAVTLYQPLILPIVIPLLAELLIAFGAHRLDGTRPRKRRRRKSKAGKRKRQTKPRATRPAKALPQPLPDNVVTLPRRATRQKS